MKHSLDRLFAVLALHERMVDVAQLREAYQGVLRGENASVLQALAHQGVLRDEDRSTLDQTMRRYLCSSSADILVQCGASELLALLQADPQLQDIWLTKADSTPRHGQYQLVKLHGEGSLGSVWLARDEHLGRTVALKELKPEAAKRPDAQARFHREARITGKLEHPFIVPVYESRQGSQPYYTMRFVRGVTLAEAIEQHHSSGKASEEWSLHRLLTAFESVCQAVAFAHASGIVHRDLKPANIVLGEFGEVFVLDWGLAKDLKLPESSSGSTTIDNDVDLEATSAGQLIGTPAYMSPEQASGAVQAIGPASDIYSLGAILFHILTNHSPHSIHGGTSPKEYLERVSKGKIPRVREVRSNAPPELDAICARALALVPEQRYARVQALSEDINRWQRDEPVSVYREPWTRRLGRWAVRHRRLTMGTALALVTMAVTITAFATATAKDAAMVKRFSVTGLESRCLALRAAILIEMANAYHDARANAAMSMVKEFVRATEAGGPVGAPRDRLKQDWKERLEQKPFYLGLSVIDARNDWSTLLRLERERSLTEVRIAPDNGVRVKALKSLLGKRKPTHPSIYLEAHQGEASEGSRTSIVIAAPVDCPGQDCWLVSEVDLSAFLAMLLDPFEGGALEVFVRDGPNHPLTSAGKHSSERPEAGPDLVGVDPRLGKFLAADHSKNGHTHFSANAHPLGPPDPDHVLFLSSSAPTNDILYAVQVYYNSDQPDGYLALILVAPFDEVLGQTAASRDFLIALAALVFVALVGIVLLAARLTTNRDRYGR